MSELIRRTFYFCLIGLSFVYAKSLFLLHHDRYQLFTAGKETYFSIKKSKQKSKIKVLLLGDSVCKQLFDSKDKNDSINSLACNQAIGVVGQYLLLDNYFKVGNRPEEVFLAYAPSSFINNLDQTYTYQHFLKPFYTEEYLPLFSSTVISQINKIPFSSLSHEPYILTSNWVPDFESTERSNTYSFLSPISKEYLSRIKELCDTYNVKLYLVATPTKTYFQANVLNFDKREFKGLNLEGELEVYLNSIRYKNDDLFIDKVHLKHPELFKNEMLNTMNNVKREINQRHLKMVSVTD